MRIALLLAATLVTAPALAQTPTVARSGQTVRDGNAARVGVVDRVLPDGSLRLIVGSRFVTVPADKVNVADGTVTTSLTKKEVAKLR